MHESHRRVTETNFTYMWVVVRVMVTVVRLARWEGVLLVAVGAW